MRRESEIRREVETRLRRRGLLLVNGGLWAAAVFILSILMPRGTLGTTLTGLLIVSMLAWTLTLLLHTLRVVYVELRERLVRGAIERERQFYLLRDNYEKRKHSEDREREDDALMHLTDDGELIDLPAERKVKADYER